MNLFHKIRTVASLTFFVIAVAVGVSYTRSAIQASPVGAPYGGFVTYVTCSCSPNIVLLTFTPGFLGPLPSAFQMTYLLGSEGFAYWNMGVQEGIWSVGSFGPPLQCLEVGFPCEPVGVPIGNVLPLTGTSL
jgi:hypothetical protein